ncbi:MAG: hypothetical protein PHE15_05615 [Dehalococcoidales bacterium]|nr:hypothetical protein [Dehalococcoidales bacterium]
MSVVQQIRTLFGMIPAATNAMSETTYTEDHLHNRERWIGIRAPQTATQWADYATLAPFVFISGNNTWGGATQILGSADTPYFTGNLKFDFHRGLITANTQNTVYRVRIIWDQVASAAGIAAGTWTEFMFIRDAAGQQRKIFEMKSWKIPVGYFVWGQCWNVTNLASIDIFFGIHEYNF